MLDTPSSSPRRGTIGVYSDSDRHLAIVTVLTDGTRLFIDQTAAVYSTNIEEHVIRFLHAELPYRFNQHG